MNEKRYEEVLKNRGNYTQNQMALAIVLNEGKNRLLDDDVIKKTFDEIDNREPLPKGQVYLMTKDFQKEVVEIARVMAELSDIELFRYIKNEVNIPKQQKSNVNRHQQER